MLNWPMNSSVIAQRVGFYSCQQRVFVVIVARSFICQCLDLVLNRLTCVHVICLLPAAQLFWFIRVLYKFQCASSTLTSMLINEIIQTILKWLMTFELCALKCAFKWRIVKLFILLLCKCMAIFFYCSCSFHLFRSKFRVQCTLNVYSPFWVDPFESSNDSKWYIYIFDTYARVGCLSYDMNIMVYSTPEHCTMKN